MKKCDNCKKNYATGAMIFSNNHKEIGGLSLCNECSSNLLTSPHASIEELIVRALQNSMGIGAVNVSNKPKNQKNGILDNIGTNITKLAEKGALFPLSGREKEIDNIIDILNRMTKNNVVLIGEPGVGKTAIVEGLAQRIVDGNVPAKMLGKQIYSIDVAAITEGTGIRGDFEKKLLSIIEEAKERKDVILFIDEMHMIMGAGDPSGKLDMGNILKPAMARGDIQIIGATTSKEYKIIEKDPALERRIQTVTVNEPSIEESIEILKALKPRFEAYHGVHYPEETIIACVEIANKYIHDRYMPDKAIDLMDIAGSRLNLQITTDPLAKLRRKLKQLEEEKTKAVENDYFEKAAAIRQQENALIKEINELQNQELSKEQKVYTVSIDSIAQIVEEKTGIPATRLTISEKEKINQLHDRLKEQVIGQNEAVTSVAKAIRRSRVGLKKKGKPVGSFLFVGPTGVGKTELARKLTEELFGDEDAMIRLDMSEYMEKHSVSRLIGAPPGYVGFDEGGQLTDRVRRKPYSVILLDEIEKAHPDVTNILLQILEDGRLTDSHGKQVSFENTIIIATSNAGATQKKTKPLGFGEISKKEEHSSFIDSLKDYFRPELLNRFDDIIQFNDLSTNDLIKIVDLSLKEVFSSLKEQSIKLSVTKQAKENLAKLGYNPSFGARELNRTIQREIVDPITDILSEKDNVTSIEVRGKKSGELQFISK